MANKTEYPRKPFTRLVMAGYLEAIQFTEMHSDNEELEHRTADDLSAEALAGISYDIVWFLFNNADLVTEYMLHGQTADQLGHDLWLTRNHHGAGFWDRGLGDLGDKLTEAAHAMGESYICLGDDEKVHTN